MDDGRGNFAPLSEGVVKDLKKVMRDEARNLPRVFTIGQVVEVNGSRFTVAKIARRRLILKLMPDEAA